MKKAPETDTRKKQDTAADKEFEETFKPKEARVNFGVLKNEKVKKAKRSRKKPLLILLVLVLLLGSAGAALYFTGMMNPVLQQLGIVKSTGDTQSSLEEREALVASKEAELDKREKSLDQREKQLEEQEAAQQAETENPVSTETFEDRMKSFSDDELAYLKKVSSIYSKMDPAQAAAIMGSMYDLTEISTILYYMQPAASALVLGQMETGRAANITEMMLS